MTEDFKQRWLKRFTLSESGWRNETEAHLRELPFAEPAGVKPLLVALFHRVPAFLRRHHDPDSVLLAEAFAWCCHSFWQCGSGLPAFPENYAGYFLGQLFRGKRHPNALLLARLIVSKGRDDGRCGFNRLQLARPELVRESERRMLEGGYEFYSNAEIKYREFLEYLRCSDEFRRDWAELKRQFPRPTGVPGILHRTLLPERNWERGRGALFNSSTARFRAAFDLFCWKYYLWGMRGDEPLLMKPSVVFTPLGTQIFIPGYLSLDAKRDLDFGKISQLHRARGLTRQGAGFSIARKEYMELRIRAQTADREARRKGLKGDARYAFIRKALAFPEKTDYRRIRFLLGKSSDHNQKKGV